MASKFKKFRKKTNPTPTFLKIVTISTLDTVGSLQHWVAQNGPGVQRDGVPYHVTISGYDSDPRELWQIPEVVALAQRIIKSGMFSFLAGNAGAERIDMLLGLLDIYAYANGLVRNYALEIDGHEDHFLETLKDSNQVAFGVLASHKAG